jgi:hypothetical protein
VKGGEHTEATRHGWWSKKSKNERAAAAAAGGKEDKNDWLLVEWENFSAPTSEMGI